MQKTTQTLDETGIADLVDMIHTAIGDTKFTDQFRSLSGKAAAVLRAALAGQASSEDAQIAAQDWIDALDDEADRLTELDEFAAALAATSAPLEWRFLLGHCLESMSEGELLEAMQESRA